LSAPSLDGILRNSDKTGLQEQRNVIYKRRREGRIFSRSLVGMYLPGEYFFVTFTSSKKSGDILKKWDGLRKWLQRKYFGIKWLYAFTNEGLGVLHMIWRLPVGTQQPKIDEINEYWEKAHNAFAWISRAYNGKGLANYISEQNKRRKGMAVELSQQCEIIKWRMGTGWVPVGFMKAFGRFYFNLGSNLDDHTQKEFVRDWIISCDMDLRYIKYPPHLKGDIIQWSEIS
jgi:hypothetical protein